MEKCANCERLKKQVASWKESADYWREMIIHNVEQGTPEWFTARRGKITASRFADVLAKGKGLTRLGYMRELAAEIITGESGGFEGNKWTERGTELEPLARQAYANHSGNTVFPVGFCEHDILSAGASPDGLIEPDGGLEIKCPKPATHIEYLEAGTIPPAYVAQVQGSLWITERSWWDFCSFCPGMRLLCVRVERDEEYISNLEMEVERFESELNELVERVTETKG
jgi:putative phage-type endonuclease